MRTGWNFTASSARKLQPRGAGWRQRMVAAIFGIIEQLASCPGDTHL
jgi:hypothetical protein